MALAKFNHAGGGTGYTHRDAACPWTARVPLKVGLLTTAKVLVVSATAGRTADGAGQVATAGEAEGGITLG